MSCDNREKAVWIRGSEVRFGVWKCAITHERCTDRIMRECPFSEERKKK